jgi:hypothetical protein
MITFQFIPKMTLHVKETGCNYTIAMEKHCFLVKFFIDAQFQTQAKVI